MRNIKEKISYLIKAREQVFEAVAPRGKKFSLEELQKFVGGHIEFACITADGYRMFVNEEGKLKTQMINKHASALYQQVMGPIDLIVGDVILCHPKHVR